MVTKKYIKPSVRQMPIVASRLMQASPGEIQKSDSDHEIEKPTEIWSKQNSTWEE